MRQDSLRNERILGEISQSLARNSASLERHRPQQLERHTDEVIAEQRRSATRCGGCSTSSMARAAPATPGSLGDPLHRRATCDRRAAPRLTAMPEGDTIHYAARRIRPLVEGLAPEISHPNPRLRGERWPDKLAGRAVTSVDVHGKHLFVRFDGGLTIHSHLRMTGSWGTYRDGQRWRRAARRAWLVLRTERGEVVQFDGPVLELMTDSRTRFDKQLSQLGPDILAPELDERRFLRRLREDDPTRADRRGAARPAHDRRHRQHVEVRGLLRRRHRPVAPGRRGLRRRGARDRARDAARMQQSALDGMQDAHRVIYAKAGQPCPRCGEPIRSRGQGDDNRITYWCAGCQA